MIRVVFFDAGGVLFLNRGGELVENEQIITFMKHHQADYRFGVLSSTDIDLDALLEALHLRQYFEYVQTSGSSSLAKDTPEFFLEAVRAVGVAPEEAIMVDNDDDFLRAAKDAGLQVFTYTPKADLEKLASHEQ